MTGNGIPLRSANSSCASSGWDERPATRFPSRAQLGVRVAEAAGLRRAAARAGRLVPPGQRRYVGPTGARIDVEHVELADVDRPLRRLELEVRQLDTGQVVGGAVVHRHRQVNGKRVRIVAHAAPHILSAARA